MCFIDCTALTIKVYVMHKHVCSIILQRDILSCAEHLDQLEEDLGAMMASLKEIVQSKTAVPTSQVYVSCTVKGGGGG